MATKRKSVFVVNESQNRTWSIKIDGDLKSKYETTQNELEKIAPHLKLDVLKVAEQAIEETLVLAEKELALMNNQHKVTPSARTTQITERQSSALK